MKFAIYTLENLVKNKDPFLFESNIQRETKTQIILENGLRFSKKNKRSLDSKENQKILKEYKINVDFLYKRTAILT